MKTNATTWSDILKVRCQPRLPEYIEIRVVMKTEKTKRRIHLTVLQIHKYPHRQKLRNSEQANKSFQSAQSDPKVSRRRRTKKSEAAQLQ